MNISLNPADSLGQIVTRHPRLRAELGRLGLDYCCHGNLSLAEAARNSGRDPEEIVRQLESAASAPEAGPSPDAIDWSQRPCAELIQHLESTHHVYLKTALPRIAGLLGKVKTAHAQRHGRMLEALADAFSGLSLELGQHLHKEEQVLFPLIRRLESRSPGELSQPAGVRFSPEAPIRRMEQEHDQAGAALAEMRRLTDGYTPPPDACPTFIALYEELRQLEDDLHLHIHLENNILFPKALALD